MLINPTIPIDPQASEVHGIYDADVADKPTFKQIAKSLSEQLEGYDIGGYNSDSFDVNLLLSEMDRAGVEFSLEGKNFVDVFTLYRKLFPNTLGEVYKRLVGKELEGAHDALVDVRATKEILDIILPVELETAEQIDIFCQGDKARVDMGGKIYKDEEGYKWSFSKNKDQLVTSDRGFANWVLNNDFPKQTKDIIRKIINNEQ